MAAPIGKTLREARLARGLTLDDVHHRTRIPRGLVAAMENDDLGAFPNQTYARKFFAAYGGHLGVDMSEFLRHFQPHGLGGIMQFHPYLQPGTDRTGPAAKGARTRHPGAPSGALFVGLAALALAAGLAVWTGMRDRAAPTTVTVPPAPGTPRRSSDPAAGPGRQGGLAAITPPELPVLRATPVEDDASDAPDAVTAKPSGASSLPLVESPRLDSPRPPRR